MKSSPMRKVMSALIEDLCRLCGIAEWAFAQKPARAANRLLHGKSEVVSKEPRDSRSIT